MTTKSLPWGLAIALAALGWAGSARAGGSISYEDIKEKFPEQAVLFETLEMALDFADSGYALIRPMYVPGGNEKFVGARFGPYRIRATQKFGERREVLVIFDASVTFHNADGKEVEGPFDAEAAKAEETFLGVDIEVIPGGAWVDE